MAFLFLVVIFVFIFTFEIWLYEVNFFDSNADEIEYEEKEHSSLQEKFDMELKELDRKLEQKEVKEAHILILRIVFALSSSIMYQ